MNESLFQKISSEFFFESVLPDREKNLAVRKHRLFFIHRLEIARDQPGHPAATMDHVRWPAEFFNRFQCSFTKENGAKAIVLVPFLMLIMKNEFPFEQFLVVQEVHLEPCIR